MTTPPSPLFTPAPPTHMQPGGGSNAAFASGEPRLGRRRRRVAGWAAVAVGFILLAFAAVTISDAARWSDLGALDPESAGPDGARAIARVLEQQGVDVRVERDAASARAALGPDTTLVLPDAPGLSDGEIEELAAAAGTVVLVEPRSGTLDLLLPGSSARGFAGDDPLEADCDLAGRADEIVAGELYSPGAGVTGCFPLDGDAALLGQADEDRRIWAVDARALFANDAIDRSDNAALSLFLLGERPTVVWYMPSLADATGEGAPTLGELTPRWVTPAAVLLVVAAIVAAIWRGRRFGPLVAENLPVTVRGSETSVGRGRLYANGRDAPHALDQLRDAARRRLAVTLGLPPRAADREVADAAAARLGVERSVVHDILIDAVPTDDRSLVALNDRLRDLEARVRAAVDPRHPVPEGNAP